MTPWGERAERGGRAERQRQGRRHRAADAAGGIEGQVARVAGPVAVGVGHGGVRSLCAVAFADPDVIGARPCLSDANKSTSASSERAGWRSLPVLLTTEPRLAGAPQGSRTVGRVETQRSASPRRAGGWNGRRPRGRRLGSPCGLRCSRYSTLQPAAACRTSRRLPLAGVDVEASAAGPVAGEIQDVGPVRVLEVGRADVIGGAVDRRAEVDRRRPSARSARQLSIRCET